jgi:DNA-binding MarR family transcriptional regulator
MGDAEERQRQRAVNRLIKKRTNQIKDIYAPLLLFSKPVLKHIKNRHDISPEQFRVLIAVYITQDEEQRTDTNRVLSVLHGGYKQNVSKVFKYLEAKRMILKIANKNPNRRRGNVYTCTGEAVYLFREFTRLINDQAKSLREYKNPL